MVRKKTDFPGVEHLITVHEIYRRMVEGRADSINVAARQIDISEQVAHRRIDAFEQAIQERHGEGDELRIFERSKGGKTIAIDDGRIQQLMDEVATVVQGYQSIRDRELWPLTVGIACGSSLGRLILPRLVSRMEPNSATDIHEHAAFKFKHERAGELRRIVQQYEAGTDFVIMRATDDMREETGQRIFEFRTALVGPRGLTIDGKRLEDFTKNEPFAWQALADEGNVLVKMAEDEPSRRPLPKLPKKGKNGLAKNQRMLSVASTTLAMRLVMYARRDVHKAVTVTCPQVLRGDDREKVDANFLSELEPMRFALVRLDQFRGGGNRTISPKKRELLDRIEVELQAQLKRMAEMDWPQSRSVYLYHSEDGASWQRNKCHWRFDGFVITDVGDVTFGATKHEECKLLARCWPKQGWEQKTGLPSQVVGTFWDRVGERPIASFACSQRAFSPLVGWLNFLSPDDGPLTSCPFAITESKESDLSELSRYFGEKWCKQVQPPPQN